MVYGVWADIHDREKTRLYVGNKGPRREREAGAAREPPTIQHLITLDPIDAEP